MTFTPELQSKARLLIASGLRPYQVASELGVSLSRLVYENGKLKKAGLPLMWEIGVKRAGMSHTATVKPYKVEPCDKAYLTLCGADYS